MIKQKLYAILGINIPTIEEIREQTEENVVEEQVKEEEAKFLAHITFALARDGNVHVNTEWLNESPQLASVYAQLLYQVSSGTMEEGVTDVLIKYGSENVKSQEFISDILNRLNELKSRYKNMPLITPSQALAAISPGK